MILIKGMKLKEERRVEIVSTIKKFKINKRKIINFALDVMDYEKIQGCLVIYFCGREKIRFLNKKFRKKDRVTDVLSFPPNQIDNHQIKNVESVLFGEVAICVDVANQNAKRNNINLSDEIMRLIVHSILHLKGYDHENDNGEMEKREKKVLGAFNVKAL